MKFAATPLFFVLSLHLLAAQSASPSFDDLARQAEAAIDSNPSEAVTLYRRAVELRPQWAEGWLYLGATLLKLGRFAEASDALKKGAGLAPNRGTPWAYLGISEYELGNYPEALADILKGEGMGLADSPAFIAAARYRAALVELRLSSFAEALEQLRPLVKAGNESPPVIEALGLGALQRNTLPQDLTAAQRPLVELAGRAAWAFMAERADLSRFAFGQLLQQFPREPGVHYMYGMYLLDGKPGAAEAEFHQELALSPSHVLARIQLATLLLGRGDGAAALEIAQQAATLQPDSGVCQMTLGRALLSAGRTEKAIAAMQQAVKLAPDVARFHFYLQQAYLHAGRVEEARKEKGEFNRLRALQEPEMVQAPNQQTANPVPQ